MIKKILGPPGTGNTFTLLNHLKEYIKKGTPLHRIGYFAFTRKAAYNARDTFLEDDNFIATTNPKSVPENFLSCSTPKLKFPKESNQIHHKKRAFS